jgi:hypothetical protein
VPECLFGVALYAAHERLSHLLALSEETAVPSRSARPITWPNPREIVFQHTRNSSSKRLIDICSLRQLGNRSPHATCCSQHLDQGNQEAVGSRIDEAIF